MSLRDYGFLFDEHTEELEEIQLQDRTIPAGLWITVENSEDYLRRQREALGYTQQQVADIANITLRQYQRFESGERHITTSSFRIGLNVCYALKIDPMFYCDIKS